MKQTMEKKNMIRRVAVLLFGAVLPGGMYPFVRSRADMGTGWKESS